MRIIHILVTLSMGLSVAAYAEEDPHLATSAESEKGQDAPRSHQEETLRKILISIQSIEAHSELNGWTAIIDYGTSPKLYDLLTLGNDRTTPFGFFYLPPDEYSQVRLNLTPDNRIEVDGEHGPEFEPLDVPSGEQGGIKLIHPFTVRSEEVLTAIVLDFDADDALKYSPDRGYSLNPTIPIAEIYETTEPVKFISASQGGTIDLFGEIALDIPPGALREDTTITICPQQPLAPPQLSSTRTAIGRIYEVRPRGLNFNEPILMTIHYEVNEVKEKQLAEKMQKITQLSDDDGALNVFDSTVDTVAQTVTGNITHFSQFTISSTVSFVFKYWFMRERLRRKFLNVGTDGPINGGYCLPCEMRVSFQADNFIDNKGKDDAVILWGDATAYLGWYIGVLATEYHMLSHPSRFKYFGGPNDARNVLIELYCALNALERLDKNGEEHMWRGQYPRWETTLFGAEHFIWPDHPGFFIRDDVPWGFQERLKNKTAEEQRAFINSMPSVLDVKVHPMRSDFIDPYTTNKQMSQDQVIHLLMGLSLVKKFVPTEAHYKGFNFLSFAERKAEEITSWVATHNWRIKDPVKPEIRHFGHIPWFDPFHPVEGTLRVVQRGGNTRALAQGINLMNYYINNKHWSNDWAWLWPPVQDLLFTWTMAPLKDYLLGGTDVQTGSLVDNLHMAMAAAAVGDGWDLATFGKLMVMAGEEDFYLYPLLNRVLHDPIPGLPLGPLFANVTSMLDTAPVIGPHANYGLVIPGWASANRFTKDRVKRNEGAQIAEEYNGLDYMLLHNLYYIRYESEYTSALISDRDRLDDIDIVVYDLPQHAYNIPPLGYPSFGTPRYERQLCHDVLSVDIFMTIGDIDGDDRNIVVNYDQPVPPIGVVRQDSQDNNKFVFEGLALRNTHYESSFNVFLTDEDGLSNTIHIPLLYDGLTQNPPKVGAVAYYTRTNVSAWWEGIPLWGTHDLGAEVYVVDWEGDRVEWAIIGLENCWAAKTEWNRMDIVVGWSLLQLNGTGAVIIRAVDECGAVTDHRIDLWW